MQRWVSVIGLAALAGCFKDSASADDGAGPCIPGEQRNCDCPGAPAAGVQTCQADGGSFDACMCGGTDATGSGPSTSGNDGGSGAADSSGGTTGGAAVDKVTLYVSAAGYPGNLSAQANGAGQLAAYVDLACQSDGTAAGYDCNEFAAALWLPERPLDNLADALQIEGDPEVWGPDKKIADHLSDLQDTRANLLRSPADAGFPADTRYWSGLPDTIGGPLNDCMVWSTAAGQTGAVGNSSYASIWWIYFNLASCDDATVHLLCMCW